ncbi:FIG00470045: hypothetical protein [hydrothermal vent metagenome]|uniref:Uncharacterized protein n=1 Tax=hydrothermal vent metagenome TaxID=652676 RepID=A0A1W1BFL8_9ZZZZ
MKYLLPFLLVINLQADITTQMFQLFEKKEYAKSCTLGFRHFQQHKHNETFVSLYAFSCLKSDYIDRLSQPIIALKFSTEARKNAAYFTTILLQKKLLYYALIDGYDLSKFQFPTTDYVLSKVFDLYSKSPKKHDKKFYIFNDLDNPNLSYKLFLIKKNNINKMVIEEYLNKIKIKRHIYW